MSLPFQPSDHKSIGMAERSSSGDKSRGAARKTIPPADSSSVIVARDRVTGAIESVCSVLFDVHVATATCEFGVLVS